jgi:1-acyl-sn-glycerol-3-phosphate acyltransferase
MFFRTFLVWIIGLPITLLLFICVLISHIFDRSGNSVHSIGVIGCRIVLFLSGVKVGVRGIENVPEGPIVFASNHQGAFDILVLQSHIPTQFRWVSKESLFKIPIVGWSMSLAGYISIDRGRAALAYRSIEKAADRVRREGISVVMFPEGTRSTTGKLLPFKRGSFLLALKCGVPIVPVSIQGTRDIMKKGSVLIRSADVKIVVGRPIDVAGIEEAELTKIVRKAIENGLR